MSRITKDDKAELQKIKARALRAGNVEKAKAEIKSRKDDAAIAAVNPQPQQTNPQPQQVESAAAQQVAAQKSAITEIAQVLYDSISPVATPVLEPWEVTQTKQATLCSAWAAVIYEKMPDDGEESALKNLPMLLAAGMTVGILGPVAWDSYRMARGKTVLFRRDRDAINAEINGTGPKEKKPAKQSVELARDLDPIVSGQGGAVEL